MQPVNQCRERIQSPSRIGRKLRRTVVGLIGLPLLSSCGPWHLPAYGYIDRDDPPLEKVPVVMSGRAPSIPQGFKPIIEYDNDAEIIGHTGIDIMAAANTPVIAAASGTVIASKWGPFYGHQIYILHDAARERLHAQSHYWHLRKRLVKVGDRVQRGQPIGTLGSSGLLASYPHLHFEFRISETRDRATYPAVNPHGYWIDGPGKVSCFEADRGYDDDRFGITYPVPCK